MNVQALHAAARGAGCRALVRSWLRWRGDRLLPCKKNLNLADIAQYLPWVGLLEVLGPDDVRMRLAGTALRDQYGAEMTGKNVKEITAPKDWPGRQARYVALISQPCGSFYSRHDILPNGKTVTYETVGLPLDVDDAGTSRQMIFCVAPLSQTFALDPPTGPRALPIPSDFVFVDIGAGVPDRARLLGQ